MIQIDIDLPETCGDCPMKEIYHKSYYCGLIDDFIRGYKRYQERDKRCPLREPKIGHWSKISNGTVCSICRGYAIEIEDDGPEILTDYCPWCGAKMEVESEE